MEITSQMVFRLLSRKYPVRIWEHSGPDIRFRTPQLYRGQMLESGHLYLMDEMTDFNSVHQVDGCAVLILTSAPLMLPDIFRRANVAFITDYFNKFEIFDEVCNLIYGLQEWDNKLKDAFHAGASPQTLMEMSLSFLPVLLVLYDGEQAVSCGDSLMDNQESTYNLFLEMGYKHYPSSETPFLYQDDVHDTITLCQNVLLDGKVNAVFLAACSRQQYAEGDIALFSHLAGYVAKAHLNHIACGHTRKLNDKQHQLLIQSLYKENYKLTPQDLLIFNRFGWRENHEYMIIYMKPIRKIASQLDDTYIRVRLERDWPDSCVLPDGSAFVWVLNLSRSKNPETLRRYLTEFIREHMIYAGVSNSRTGLSGLATLYQQACTVLSLGLRKNPDIWLFEFRNYLLDYIFEKFSCEFSAEQVIHPGIYRLMDYDKKNDMDYVKTLQYYIQNHFNASDASQELYIHRSTFLRRIARIEEIAGIHLDNPDDLLHVMISLRLCEMMNTADTDRQHRPPAVNQ